MLRAIAVILGFQLVGEGASRAFDLPAPGPVVGLILLFAAFCALPRLAEEVRPTANGLLSHLALLFVPAGVGVLGHLDALAAVAGEVAIVLVASTLIAVAAAAAAFLLVERLTGRRGE
ncbi:MAG: CidA/LrgA family protein [Pseudomonadota bacterium]